MTTSPVEADPGPVNTPAAPPAHVEIGARRWALATAALGVYILLAEIDRLIGMIPDEHGHVWGIGGALNGPGRLTSYTFDQLEGFLLVLAKPGASPLAAKYLLLDLMFVWLYGWVFLRLRTRSPLLGLLTTGTGPNRLPGRITFERALALGACFDVVENLLMLMPILAPDLKFRSAPWLYPWFWVCSGATFVKWVGLLTAVGLALWKLRADSEARACVARGRRAIYAQRYSILAVLPIAALSLIPGGDIMDQLPDVQRRWLTAEGWAPFEEWHPWVAVVLLIVEALALFAMGRLVTEHEWRRSQSSQVRPSAKLRWWVVGPVLAVSIAGVTWKCTGRLPDWWPFGLFVGIPLAIAAFSLVCRSLPKRKESGTSEGQETQPHPTSEFTAYEDVWVVGDLLSVSVLSIGCLAIVRSYAAVEMLTGNAQALVWTAFGLAGGALVWFVSRAASRCLDSFANSPDARPRWRFGLFRWLARELTPGLLPTTTDDPRSSTGMAPGKQEWQQRLVTVALIAMGLSFLAVLCGWPRVTEYLGVVGTALASLLGLSLLVGGSTVLHRQWEPPEALTWRPIRAKETPVASLMLLTITLGAFLGGTDLHLAQGVSPGVPRASRKSRVDLDGWFTTWRERQKGCTLPVGGSRVTPLLLVAAEGGGIRAAYWTAAVLDKLAAVERGAKSGTPESVGSPSAGCGAGQILLASGVSGGAVGLAVSRYAGQDGKAREQVKKLGQPGALSAASAGLFVRDWVAGATGIRYFSGGTPKWQDRAALMENAWVTAVPGLQTGFLNHPSDANARGFTASLLLNSTSVATGCRMIVSQVDLTKRSGQSLPKQSTPCGDVISPYGGSVDLLAQVGPDRSSDGSPSGQLSDQRCLTELTAATAAMFASRFPYVTPSGVVGPCGDGPMEQLIDGGYAEGTGLGTLTEVAPEIMRLIRDCNATAAAQGRPFIVPFVVYLDNGTGTGLATDRPGKTVEALVPPTGFLHNGKALVSTAALLQRLADITDPRGLAVGPDAQVIEEALGHRISVVHQWAKPAINAPLGWTLSQASVTTMDSAIEALAQCPTGEKVRSDPTVEMLNRQGYGRLYDVLKSLGADDCSP